MVQAIGYSYNHTYFAGNYSSNLNIKAIVPIYPGSKLLRWGYKLFELGDLLWFINRDTPIISGTSDPDSATFNPLWVYLDPLYLTSNESGQVIIPNTFLVQGTHDFQVPPAWSRDFEAHLRLHKRKVTQATRSRTYWLFRGLMDNRYTIESPLDFIKCVKLL